MSPPEVEYPFKEFFRHYTEINEQFEQEGATTPLEARRIIDRYMNTRLPAEELVSKSLRFTLIATYLSNHLDEFDQGDLAVVAEPRSLVKEHLWKAIHHFYANVHLDDITAPSPKAVRELAARFKAEESAER